MDITPLQDHGWTRGRKGTLQSLFAEAADCAEIFVHFQVWMYRDGTRRSKLVKYLWPQLVLLVFLLRNGRRTTMVVHESRYRLYEGPLAFLQYPLVALLFWVPRKLVFHTPQEVKRFRRLFLRGHGIQVRPHHADFRPRVALSKAEARRALGVPPDERLVLCIGFYKVHKGFPRFARAFSKLCDGGRLPVGTRLRLVVSVQDDGDAASRKELAQLQDEFSGSPAVQIHVGFLEDTAFDTWIAAADAVALPYLNAFSSGVAARARVMNRVLLVRNVGGLADQAGAGGAVYETDAELETALRQLL